MTVTAWRGWALWGDGELRGPAHKVRHPAVMAGRMLFGYVAPLTVWPWGESVASCRKGCRTSPQPQCSCGVYGVEDLRELLGYTGSVGNPWCDDGHAIGQVELTGRIVRGGNPYDPPSTVRGERGRAVSLYLARPLWDHIPGLQARHRRIEVHRVETLTDVPALVRSAELEELHRALGIAP